MALDLPRPCEALDHIQVGVPSKLCLQVSGLLSPPDIFLFLDPLLSENPKQTMNNNVLSKLIKEINLEYFWMKNQRKKYQEKKI